MDLYSPIYTDQTCATLQYADDTIVVCRSSIQDIQLLKNTLDQFALASGLKINYAKSTLIAMHTPEDEAASLAQILQCKIEDFPMSYLGLPLTPSKVRKGELQPMIARADRYLAGWQARLLSYAERLVLVNAILDIIPVYAMSAIKIPKGVVEDLTKKREEPSSGQVKTLAVGQGT